MADAQQAKWDAGDGVSATVVGAAPQQTAVSAMQQQQQQQQQQQPQSFPQPAMMMAPAQPPSVEIPVITDRVGCGGKTGSSIEVSSVPYGAVAASIMSESQFKRSIERLQKSVAGLNKYKWVTPAAAALILAGIIAVPVIVFTAQDSTSGGMPGSIGIGIALLMVGVVLLVGGGFLNTQAAMTACRQLKETVAALNAEQAPAANWILTESKRTVVTRHDHRNRIREIVSFRLYLQGSVPAAYGNEQVQQQPQVPVAEAVAVV